MDIEPDIEPDIEQLIPDTRPNIIVILADDLGYSDIGAYGGEIETPNLDYLAKNGLRFTQFYNASRCCPTRAALLTGLYNHNAGIGEMTTRRAAPGYQGALNKQSVTIAEVLKQAGYNTAMTGKWHVSNTIEQPSKEAQLKWLNHQEDHPLFSPINQYPTKRGFDRYYGTLWGVIDFFDPFSLVNDTTPVKSVPGDYYHTDALNDSAAAFIKTMSKNDAPFFLYVAENAPHWPLQAKPKDIEKYKNTYTKGWDQIRQDRYRKMVAMGLIDPSTAPLSPRLNNELVWDKNPDKEWDAHAMAVHAAMIDNMDQGIGRIIQALKETGRLQNTLIVFLSDNGASPEDCSQYGPGFDRPGQTRNGENINYPTDKKTLPGPQTTFGSIGARWANVANTPYQFAKAESYEGGVRTPFIAYWPKGIKAKPGTFSRQPGHVMDLMATFVELARTKYPVIYKGEAIHPLQGVSLVPALSRHSGNGERISKSNNARTDLYNEHFNARSIREGDWKLVSRPSDSSWHLYHLTTDQTELNDLAPKEPARVERLKSKWFDWAHKNNVLPKTIRK
ncbi:MAG: arylsulfatase [Chitinophagaceae bacterium]|nr:MAG: arylsulfatase [Chitinophagaceae bacterium]